MKNKGEIIEINLRYNGHMVNILHNVVSIEVYKESVEYKSFKAVFGDLLYKNVFIDGEKAYTIPNAYISISIAQAEPTIEDFEMFLNNIFKLLDIPLFYRNNIIEKIVSSYPKPKQLNKYMYHNIVIINSIIDSIQLIKFDHMVVTSKSTNEYNFILREDKNGELEDLK